MNVGGEDWWTFALVKKVWRSIPSCKLAGVKWQSWIEILAAALVSLWQICFTVFWPDSYIIQILSVCPHAWKETGVGLSSLWQCACVIHHGLCSNYSSIAIAWACASLCTRLLCAGLVMIGVSFDSRFFNPSSTVHPSGTGRCAEGSAWKIMKVWFQLISLVDKKRTRCRGRSTFQTLLVDSRIWWKTSRILTEITSVYIQAKNNQKQPGRHSMAFGWVFGWLPCHAVGVFGCERSTRPVRKSCAAAWTLSKIDHAKIYCTEKIRHVPRFLLQCRKMIDVAASLNLQIFRFW